MKKIIIISIMAFMTLGAQAQKAQEMIMVCHEDFMRIRSVTVVSVDNYENTFEVLWDLRRQRRIEFEQTPFKKVVVGDTFMIRADIDKFNTLKWNDFIEYIPKNTGKDVL